MRFLSFLVGTSAASVTAGLFREKSVENLSGCLLMSFSAVLLISVVLILPITAKVKVRAI